MNVKIRLHWFSTSLLLLLLGCTKETAEEIVIDYGYDYFPLEVGDIRIYQVDSIIYDPIALGTKVDSSTAYFREVVADTLIDLTGNVIYRIERYYRQDLADDWIIDKVFVVGNNQDRLVWQEDNLRFVKLVFPVKENQQWNGHLFLDESLIVTVAGEGLEMFKGWSYTTEQLEAMTTIGNQSFDDVVTISHANNENLIEYRFAQEKYARGVGLIYRELHIQDTQCRTCCNMDFAACESLPWAEKAEKGFTVVQRLIDYN